LRRPPVDAVGQGHRPKARNRTVGSGPGGEAQRADGVRGRRGVRAPRRTWAQNERSNSSQSIGGTSGPPPPPPPSSRRSHTARPAIGVPTQNISVPSRLGISATQRHIITTPLQPAVKQPLWWIVTWRSSRRSCEISAITTNG